VPVDKTETVESHHYSQAVAVLFNGVDYRKFRLIFHFSPIEYAWSIADGCA
jgi:hypothetical protein